MTIDPTRHELYRSQFSSTRTLFEIAKKHQIISEWNPQDALIAILFAAAGLEALANDVVHGIRGLEPHDDYEDELRSRLGIYTSVCDVEWMPTPSKYTMLFHVLSGKTIDRGSEPIQSLELLFRVRDSIVHLKPETHYWNWGEGGIEGEPHQVAKSLAAKGLFKLPKEGKISLLVDYLQNPRLSKWAMDVVVSLLSSLFSSVQDPDIKEWLDVFHSFPLTIASITSDSTGRQSSSRTARQP
jgi:hypothetical protein